MASTRPHYYLNILAKKVNCFFILNQICHVDTLMMSRFSTQCSTANASCKIHKNLSHNSLLNKLKSPTQTSRNISHTKARCLYKNSLLDHNRAASVFDTADTQRNAALLLTTLRAQRMSTNIHSKHPASHMVWVDCEMTGLDPEQHSILEIALIVTDADLKVVDKSEIVIHESEEVLKAMDEWCVEHHTASGLVDKVRKSSISSAQADEMLTKFVSKYVGPRTAPMIGNSVYMDRMFIIRQFPLFNAHLHYRIIDVSSLKELCKMYHPKLYEKVPKKRFRHRGLEDIEDTIEEFKFYKQNFLRTADNASLAEFPSPVPYC